MLLDGEIAWVCVTVLVGTSLGVLLVQVPIDVEIPVGIDPSVASFEDFSTLD